MRSDRGVAVIPMKMEKAMKAAYVLAAIAGMLLCGNAVAQQQSIALSMGLIVYPSGGQTIEQQSQDEQECYGWSRQTTGMDPSTPGQQPAQVQEANEAGAAAGGAARAAAGGALLAAALDEDKSEWAAAAAVIGGRRGRKSAQQRNSQAQAQATAEQEQATQQNAQLFKNAFLACMEAREYTVK